MSANILKDPDVRRSAAYLAISVAVAGVKKAAVYFRDRRSNGGGI